MLMAMPSHADAFEVLCLQAADSGRGEVLFGPSLARARKLGRPFMVGEKFPSVYLEFPLIGKQFLDVTILYGKLESGTRIASEAAAGSEAMIDWFANILETDESYTDVSCGLELDTKESELPLAAIHFQPRTHKDLIEPFCAVLGEEHRGKLCLDFAKRAPEIWPLSYFGFFRGRPGSPLRVCGYMRHSQIDACSKDPHQLAKAFDEIGFTDYNDQMLAQASALMATAPQGVDFQFDIYEDGHLGPTFAIDLQFGIERPEQVAASFRDGLAARVFGLLEAQGSADERWRLVGKAAFARSVNVQLEDGSTGRYAFTLMPQWVKARWHEGIQQPSKLYHYANAGLL